MLVVHNEDLDRLKYILYYDRSMNLQTVTTTQIQRGFSKILDSLDEPVVVMRDSKPDAVVMPYDDYMDYVTQRRRMLADKVRQALTPVHAQTEKMPKKEFDALVTEALHAAGRD